MKDVLIAILDGISALGSLRIILGAGIGAVLGALAFYFTPQVATALKKPDEKSSTSVQQGGSGNVQNNYFGDRETKPSRSSGGSIFVESLNLMPLPDIYPADGLVNVLTLDLPVLSNSERRLTISNLVGKPGSAINWPDGMNRPFVSSGWKITNESGSTLLNLVLPVRISYGRQHVVDKEIEIPRLEYKTIDHRNVYVLTKLQTGGTIAIGDSATAHRPGEELIKVKVEKPASISHHIIIFAPIDFGLGLPPNSPSQPTR